MRDTEGSLDTDDDVAETLGLLVFWRFFLVVVGGLYMSARGVICCVLDFWTCIFECCDDCDSSVTCCCYCTMLTRNGLPHRWHNCHQFECTEC